MDIRENDLPGIGKKFECVTSNGDKLVAVIHDEGRVEIYIQKDFENNDDDDNFYDFDMLDEEARQFASIIGGMVYTPKKTADQDVLISDDFGIRWCNIKDNAPIINSSILESGLRERFGVLIIALLRHDGSKVLNPGPDIKFLCGDTVILSGNIKDIKDINNTLLKKEGS